MNHLFSLLPLWACYDSSVCLVSASQRKNDATRRARPAWRANPETSYNLWTTYRLPFGLTVGGGIQYMDNVYRNASNQTEAPSYTLVNLTAAYELNDNITLRLNVDNVADKAYVSNVGGGHFIPGPGRSAFVTADLRF